MLLILFGLPGAGKSYVGGLLRDEHSFTFHESDEDIPEDYRRDVAAGQVVSDERRDAFHRLLVERIGELAAAHPRLAVAAPLLRQKHRDWIRQRFPEARFVLVQCPPELWEARLRQRTTHTVDADYARKVLPLYEAPAIPHELLEDGEAEEVRRRVEEMVGRWGRGV